MTLRVSGCSRAAGLSASCWPPTSFCPIFLLPGMGWGGGVGMTFTAAFFSLSITQSIFIHASDIWLVSCSLSSFKAFLKTHIFLSCMPRLGFAKEPGTTVARHQDSSGQGQLSGMVKRILTSAKALGASFTYRRQGQKGFLLSSSSELVRMQSCKC